MSAGQWYAIDPSHPLAALAKAHGKPSSGPTEGIKGYTLTELQAEGNCIIGGPYASPSEYPVSVDGPRSRVLVRVVDGVCTGAADYTSTVQQ